MFSTNFESKKEAVRNFIRHHPEATYLTIKQATKLKIERLYKEGMSDAFRDAGVEPPRTFRRRSIEERRAILIDYIKKHPKAGGQTIAKDTKLAVCSVFKTTKEAFDAAGVTYPREIDRQSQEKKKKDIIQYIKEHPLVTVTELQKIFHVKLYKLFRGINEIYKKAGIEALNRRNKGGHRIKIRKQNQVIEFIRKTPTATQREINNACRTHVQLLFKDGIYEAYKRADINFPFERLKTYGVGRKEHIEKDGNIMSL